MGQIQSYKDILHQDFKNVIWCFHRLFTLHCTFSSKSLVVKEKVLLSLLNLAGSPVSEESFASSATLTYFLTRDNNVIKDVFIVHRGVR